MDKSVHRGPGRDAGKVLHNQWEMKPENLDIPNPAWNEFVQGIAIKAAEDMGIREDARAVRAELDSARLWAVQACLTPYKECVTGSYPGCFPLLTSTALLMW